MGKKSAPETSTAMDSATCVGPTQSLSFTCIQSIASDIRKGQFTVVTVRKILLQLDAALALLPAASPNFGMFAKQPVEVVAALEATTNEKLVLANQLDQLAMQLPSPEEASTASISEELIGALIDTLIQLVLKFYRSL